VGVRSTSRPVFLAERALTRATPTLDVCPDTGRARLSYRRAAELFAHATTPLATAAGQSTGWTLHQLHHYALTHDAESGTNTPMLLARSRHASMRSLERYARPGPEVATGVVAVVVVATGEAVVVVVAGANHPLRDS